MGAYENAVDRIRDEMAQNTNDPAVQYVGGYLTEYLRQHRDAAFRLQDEKKSIKGAMAELQKTAAKKPRSGNMVCIAPDEGLGIVLQYYGLGATPEKPRSASACGSLDLDELLGGL